MSSDTLRERAPQVAAPGSASQAAATLPAVDVIGLSRRYEAVIALDKVSLTIQRGEFFSLLGPSGCGKTTLLRIIGGFDTATEGDVRIHGRSVIAEPPYQRRTNMIFQHLALFPHMNVFENIAFGLEMKRMARADIRRKVDEALALVRLEGFEHRGIDQLSGGQRQRVAMARALVNEPDVLLLDEPLGALDLQLRLRMQVELRRLQQAIGSTFIFVTHDQGEAITMSDRIAVMNQGRLIQVGSPAEVYELPEHRFVAEFMGHSNLLPGTVGEADGRGYARFQCGRFKLEARCPRPLPSGAAALLALRYEKLDVTPGAAGGEGLPGRVLDIRYMGATTRAEVAVIDTDLVLYSDMPTSARSAALEVGQDVLLTWPRESAVAVAK